MNNSETITINKAWFEHLLNCLANQKYLHELKLEDQQANQEIINAAWKKGMDMLQENQLLVAMQNLTQEDLQHWSEDFLQRTSRERSLVNLTLHALKITDEQFEQIVHANPEWKFEQSAEGELVIVPPTGGTSGKKNLNLSKQFGIWVEDNLDKGEGFDSSTLFILPNGAKRSPDASWVRRDRWEALTQKQQDGYVPLCPDFVVELRSPTDSLRELQNKMQEYMANGVQLGWLIDPEDKLVFVYQQGQEVEVLRLPDLLLGEDVLPGFVLKLERIWS